MPPSRGPLDEIRVAAGSPVPGPGAVALALAALAGPGHDRLLRGPGPAGRFRRETFGRIRRRDRAPEPGLGGVVALPEHGDAPGFWGPWSPLALLVRADPPGARDGPPPPGPAEGPASPPARRPSLAALKKKGRR